MSLDVEYHPIAAAEVVSAEDWYENETAGLGDRFLAALEATVKRASRWPNAGKPVVIAASRTLAYQLAAEYQASGGKAGLPLRAYRRLPASATLGAAHLGADRQGGSAQRSRSGRRDRRPD